MKFLPLVLWFFVINCYTTGQNYSYSREYTVVESEFSASNPQFETGKPNLFIDGLGHYVFSLFSKLILWNWKMNNHNFSEETKQYLIDYIKDNNLTNVKVRFNQYAPLDEFRRLRKNKDIRAVARYTIGLIGWLQYTLIPDRLFGGLLGGDHYNPYTNTINVYSDLVPVVIHEGGHAKDTALRQEKTLYSLSYAIPLIPLYHEARASEDAYHYMQNKKDVKNQIDSYKQLAPAYGTYIGGQLLSNAGVVMVIPGHIYGRYKARKLKKELNMEENMENKSKTQP